MKKLTILKHGGGELANQLWNYVSIYAFGLEIDATVRNPSFYEYHYFFRFLKNESWVTKLTSRLLFRKPRRRNSFINRNQRFKYAQRAWIIEKLHKTCVYSSENSENRQTELPPSTTLPDRYTQCNNLYFTGWLFRNKEGLIKFGSELRAAFTPSHIILEKTESIVTHLHERYKNIIGVHVRQADYAKFKTGKFLISQKRVREILEEYIKENATHIDKTVFLITSDGPIDETLYKGLNIYVSKENAVIDLFLLSKTDTILGSDSSFGAFASWYGNIPHIIFKNESINWEYYRGQKVFFENKYSELMRY